MSLRLPAIIPPQPPPATALAEDPSPLLRAMLQRVWETAMHDLPFVNPALRVETIGFRRLDGDWFGVSVTPWSINLCLLPGGGRLWQDIPSGEHRQIEFPAGPLEFIADLDAGSEIPAWQYCPLITATATLADHDAARAAAADILTAVFTPPPAPEPAARSGPRPAEVPARRAFLRGVLTGKPATSPVTPS